MGMADAAIDHAIAVPSGTNATSIVAQPAIADEHTIKPAPAAMASTPPARRVTAQKVTEDTK